MIYENLIRLQVINTPAVGNGPRVLLVFAKVNMLKNEDIPSFNRCSHLIPEGRLQVVTGSGARRDPEQLHRGDPGPKH